MKKRQWLLSSMLKCDICKYGYNAGMGGTKNRPIRYYGCNGRNSLRAKIKGIGCRSPYVHADKMEAFVWSKVEELVTNPSLVLKLLDQSTQDEELTAENQKREYLDGQLNENTTRYERWKKAYEEEVITLAEYKEYREQYKKRHAELTEAQQALEKRCAHRLSYEEKKRIILAGLAELRASIPQDANREEIPFEIKRNLVRQLVDTVWVDSEKKAIRLEGVLKASYAEEATTFVFSSNPRSR